MALSSGCCAVEAGGQGGEELIELAEQVVEPPFVVQHQVVVLNANTRLADVWIHLCSVWAEYVNHHAPTLADKVGLVFKAQIADHKTGCGVVGLPEEFKILFGQQQP